LKDDALFIGEVVLAERELRHPVGLDRQHLGMPHGRDGRDIDRLVEGGVGVDVAAMAFVRVPQGALRVLRRAAEHQVLEEVGEPPGPVVLIG
jgi:hypothetical protein